MFAAGVASLLWMAALTALMIHEKTRPAGARAVPVTGAALLAAASVVLLHSAAASV
jgi:predicted metal-binding membrane protein